MPQSRKMPRPEDAPPLPPGDTEVADGPVNPEDMPEGWQLAYQRAIQKGTGEKGARLYADAHGEEFEGGVN